MSQKSMNPSLTASRTLASVWSEVVAVLFLLSLVCVIAWPGMKAPLLLDDLTHAEHVSTFSSWKDCFGKDAYGLFRPVKNLIYFGLGGLPLFQWHLLILVVHLSAILAVYLFLRRLLGSAMWAFCAAFFWASSPTQACIAVWMAAVNISLAVAMTCGCLFFHDLSRQSTGQSACKVAGMCMISVLFLCLAECSYEIAISVPALCILIDAFKKRLLFSRDALAHYSLLGAATLVYLAVRHHVGANYANSLLNSGFAPDTKGWQLTLSAPWFLWRHFSMWLVPAGRMEFLSSYIWGVSAAPWVLAASWAWLCVLIATIFFTWKRLPWVALGLLWFLITSFPTSNFIPIRAGPIEVYYLVFPGIGLAISLAGCAKALVELASRHSPVSRFRKVMVSGALLSALCFWRVLGIPLFWWQAGLWCHPLALFRQIDQSRPGQYLAQAMAARELNIMGRFEEAKVLAKKAYDTAPWGNTSCLTLGLVALNTGDFDEAEKRFSEVIQRTFDSPAYQDYARYHLAITFNVQGSKRHLVRETLQPLLSKPHGPFFLKAYLLQIDSYLARELPEEALRTVNEALKYYPTDPELKKFSKLLQPPD